MFMRAVQVLSLAVIFSLASIEPTFAGEGACPVEECSFIYCISDCEEIKECSDSSIQCEQCDFEPECGDECGGDEVELHCNAFQS